MMKRTGLLLWIEFKLAATSIPFHLVAILQPSLMFVLMALIMVHPTFEMNVQGPETPLQEDYIAAMQELGSPIGEPYIRVNIIEKDAIQPDTFSQVIRFEEGEDGLTVLQMFSRIDSNMVKNYRNRQTATGLLLWNKNLDTSAVQLIETPWLPEDRPYTIYFSMALLPMAVCIAASLVGGVLTAHDFEFNTIFEYRLAPTSTLVMLFVRILRAVLTALLSAAVLLITSMLMLGFTPGRVPGIFLSLLPMAVIASCLGICAALVFRKTIPAFVVGLASTFGFWVLGAGFGLAGGFPGLYESISRFIPNTYIVEMLFPFYYDVVIRPWYQLILVPLIMMSVLLILTAFLYSHRVRSM